MILVNTGLLNKLEVRKDINVQTDMLTCNETTLS